VGIDKPFSMDYDLLIGGGVSAAWFSGTILSNQLRI
jgi:hypothetical protein